ncbi:hypothetical protein DPMN_021377 [Dreissena polymorpha]|uniref:Uncharacterized protein n=1 Tax=Dreissena polymorpha TaxID=45954 RepID=A0A9D4NP36_DREPO|nr:hypothetical protein DPMN_021377 [Dreissena polymorpha]
MFHVTVSPSASVAAAVNTDVVVPRRLGMPSAVCSATSTRSNSGKTFVGWTSTGGLLMSEQERLDQYRVGY